MTGRPLDPRFIPFQRAVGWIVTGSVAAGSLVALVVFLLVESRSVVIVALLAALWPWASRASVGFATVFPSSSTATRRTRVDDHGIQIQRGVYWRALTNVPRSRVQHTDVRQGPLERRYGLGDAHHLHGRHRVCQGRAAGALARGCIDRFAINCCRSKPTMPSDYRLHPASVLFGLGAQLKNFAFPGVLVLVGANRAGADWEPWLMLLLVPSTLVAIVRYVSFRYRFEPNELVIRSGLVFRNERHVPYARIQNLDAVQNVAHRLLGVVEVRLQTGSGKEPEAVMSVIPVAAFEEMRRRVFQHRDVDVEAQQQPTPAPRSILRLSPRELLLCGFIENRGVVVIAAGFGLLWELGLADAWFEQVFGEETSGRGVIRQSYRRSDGQRRPECASSGRDARGISGTVRVHTNPVDGVGVDSLVRVRADAQ